MVVRFDLHEDLRGLVDLHIAPRLRIRLESPSVPTADDGCIVGVCRQDTIGRLASRVADHLEERVLPRTAVDRPISVEDLVATML